MRGRHPGTVIPDHCRSKSCCDNDMSDVASTFTHHQPTVNMAGRDKSLLLESGQLDKLVFKNLMLSRSNYLLGLGGVFVFHFSTSCDEVL